MKKLQFILLILIIAVAVFFRFWRVADYLYFTIDEERDSFIMTKIINEQRPSLIGPAVPKLTYLGPFYFNFSAILFALARQDLVSMGSIASFIGVINVFLVFLSTKRLLNKKVALIASLIYSSSFLILIYNRMYWPLTYTQMAVIGVYYCLVCVLEGNRRFILLMAVPLIIGLQSEPSTFSLVPLIILFFVFQQIKFGKEFLLLIFFTIVSHVPLLIFDFRHNHLLTNMLIQFFQGEHRGGVLNFFEVLRPIQMTLMAFSRSLFIFGPPDASLQIAPIGNYFNFRLNNIPAWFVLASIIALLYFFYSVRKDHRIKIVSFHVLIVIGGISFYNLFFPGYTFEWFVNCLFPAFCIIWAYVFNEVVKNHYFLGGLTIIILIFNLKNLIRGGNSFSLKSKIDAVVWTSQQVKNCNFELLSIGGWPQGGYRYLFSRYGKAPAKSYQDAIFTGWMYPKNNIKPTRHVIFVSELDFKDEKFVNEYNYYKSKSTHQNKFQNIEVLIY